MVNFGHATCNTWHKNNPIFLTSHKSQLSYPSIYMNCTPHVWICPQTITLYHHHKQSIQLISNNTFNHQKWNMGLTLCVLFAVHIITFQKWSKMNLVVQMFVNIVKIKKSRNKNQRKLWKCLCSIYLLHINGPFQRFLDS